MIRTARIGVLVVGLVAVLVSGCAGSGSDKAGGEGARHVVVLTLANFSSPDGTTFAAEVSRLSGGTIRIDVKAGWRLGQVAFEDGMIDDVQAGKLDLGEVGSRAWDSVGVMSLRALGAPLLIDSYALQDRVLKSPMIGQMLKALAPLGLVGLGVLPGPLRKPLGLTRPLLRPSDYAGLRIGVQQSLVADATMRALGARPVWFAAQGPITGFGGIEQQVGSIQGNRYDGVGKYLTANVNLWPRPLVLFANRAAFTKLTPVQQRILVQAAADDARTETNTLVAGERSDTEILCRRGLRFLDASSADLAALRRAVQPVYNELERDPQTRRYIAQIDAMREQVTPEKPPSCHLAASRTRTAITSPLDGVWEMTSRYGDDPTDPSPVPENYGDWIFVFDRGHFADTQVYLNACTWGYGRFTVNAHEMAWTFTNGGGIAPTGAVNKPGEFFRFGWSLYRDTMTVTPVQGATSPANFRIKPWHKISGTPSVHFFSKRCPPPRGALPG